MNGQYLELTITTSAPESRRAIASFADEFVSHGSGTLAIFSALEADPDCALGQALAAALFLTAMTREGQVQAAPRIGAAQALSPFASPREQQFIEAIAAWGRGDGRKAIRILRELVETWPHDLVAAKLCQILELDGGDIAGMARTTSMIAAVDDRAGHALGLHAFALEQAGNPDLAYRFAQRAIDLNPGRDPWAQHAAAHAMAAMGQPVEARAFLNAHSGDWDRCSSFMLTHNWWHLALFALELGDPDGALALFDQRVWGIRKGHCQDQVNAISLLARLEMAGLDAQGRWDDIAEHVKNRIGDRISNFLDLHYLYALARAEKDAAANALLAGLLGANCESIMPKLAEGIVAHGRGNYREAVISLGPIQPHLASIGGSNIQRGLFQRIFADSLRGMRAGHRAAATPPIFLQAA